MAQHFFASSEQIVDAANVPLFPAYFTDSFSQPAIPIIKKETLGGNELIQQESGSISARSNKRQKITQEGSSHKFVSQKKWKFSDGQPWLPSKTSSKAQNASKANSKHREASPKSQKPSASSGQIDSLRDHGDSVQNTVHQNIPRARNCVDLSNPRGGAEIDGVAKQNTKVPLLSNQPSQSNRRLTENRAAPSKPSMLLAKDLQEPEPRPQDQHVHSEPLLDSSQSMPSSTSRNALGRPRTSRSAHALSLEKDASRIAALIAAKRRENESSMFRERMLRKQLEHKNQSHSTTQPDTAVEASVDQDDTESALSRSPSTVSNDTPSPVENSHSSVAASTESPNLETAHHTTQFVNVPDGGVSSLRLRGSRVVPAATLEETASMQRLGKSDQDASLAGSAVASVAKIHISDQDEHSSKVTVPQAEDADVRSEFVTFTNQLLKRGSSQPAQSANASNRHSLHFEPYARQTTSPLPPSHVQAIQRTSSASSLTLRSSTNRPVLSVPSSASSSSRHTSTSMSIRQRPQLDTAPPHQSPTDFVSISNTSISSQARQNMLDASSYYTVNQHMHIPSNLLVDHPSHLDQSNYITNSGPTAPSMIRNTNRPSTTVQQQLPQPPVLVSNMNMFSGNARSDSGNGMGTLTPKPRVNMFGNTRGVPFTMHEVIRQIEMT